MNTSNHVTLTGGLTIALPALQLAWQLEARGLHVDVDGDALVVGPREALNDEDRDRIRHWKFHLMAIVGYCQQRVM